MILKIDTNDIAPSGRNTMGRKGIKLDGDDEVVIGIPISSTDKNKYIVSGTKEGKAVKINVNEIPKYDLNRKGVKLMKLADSDIIINGMVCDNKDKLLIVGTKHTKAINVSELVETSRNTVGHDIVKNEEIKNLVKL
jgi:DNA gyrase subunit A